MKHEKCVSIFMLVIVFIELFNRFLIIVQFSLFSLSLAVFNPFISIHFIISLHLISKYLPVVCKKYISFNLPSLLCPRILWTYIWLNVIEYVVHPSNTAGFCVLNKMAKNQFYQILLGKKNVFLFGKKW